MACDQVVRLGRRRVLQGMGALSLSLAGGSLLAGCRGGTPEPRSIGGGPPETSTIRVGQNQAVCGAPLHVADELLRLEGFTDVQYVPIPGQMFTKALLAGEVDIVQNFAGPLVIPVDAGEPIVMLA